MGVRNVLLLTKPTLVASLSQIADLGASRRFDQDEVARRLADHEGASMLSMTMVGTPVRGAAIATFRVPEQE